MAIGKEELINKLQLDLKKLIHLFEKEKETNKELIRQHSELSKQLVSKEREIESFEVKYNTLKMARSLSGGDDTLETKVKVSNLVREIDKCIALLNR